MATWYKATFNWRLSLKAVEVERVTDSFVVVKADRLFSKNGLRREKIAADGVRWYPTWEEARAWLRNMAIAKANNLEAELDKMKKANSALLNLEQGADYDSFK